MLAGPGAVWALMLEVLQNACRDRFPSRDAPPPSSAKCKTGETFLFIFLLSAGEQPRLRCLSRFCPNCACQRAGAEGREKRASVHQRKASRVSYMNFTTGAQESGEIRWKHEVGKGEKSSDRQHCTALHCTASIA